MPLLCHPRRAPPHRASTLKEAPRGGWVKGESGRPPRGPEPAGGEIPQGPRLAQWKGSRKRDVGRGLHFPADAGGQGAAGTTGARSRSWGPGLPQSNTRGRDSGRRERGAAGEGPAGGKRGAVSQRLRVPAPGRRGSVEAEGGDGVGVVSVPGGGPATRRGRGFALWDAEGRAEGRAGVPRGEKGASGAGGVLLTSRMTAVPPRSAAGPGPGSAAGMAGTPGASGASGTSGARGSPILAPTQRSSPPSARPCGGGSRSSLCAPALHRRAARSHIAPAATAAAARKPADPRPPPHDPLPAPPRPASLSPRPRTPRGRARGRGGPGPRATCPAPPPPPSPAGRGLGGGAACRGGGVRPGDPSGPGGGGGFP